MGMASGWYKREFDARRHSVRQARQAHGRESRDLEAPVDGAEGRREIYEPRHLRRGDVSQALSEAAHADPDRRLCRQGAAARRDGWRRLADLFLPPGRLQEIVGQDSWFRERGWKGSQLAASTPRNFRSWSGRPGRPSAKR